MRKKRTLEMLEEWRKENEAMKEQMFKMIDWRMESLEREGYEARKVRMLEMLEQRLAKLEREGAMFWMQVIGTPRLLPLGIWRQL